MARRIWQGVPKYWANGRGRGRNEEEHWEYTSYLTLSMGNKVKDLVGGADIGLPVERNGVGSATLIDVTWAALWLLFLVPRLRLHGIHARGQVMGKTRQN